LVDTLRGKVNPLYASLFASPGVFDRPAIVEQRATCDTCSMCDHGQLAPVEMDYFRPDAKCCTYYPSIANYLVGAILADTGEELAEGRRRMREKIASGIGVTPYYLAAPRKYNLLYLAARGSGAFGRTKALLCPYFDVENNGRCTVWRYREAVCSTYFCKYNDGKPGWDFWNTLKGYLNHVEITLARATAATVDPEVIQPNLEPHVLSLEDLEDRAPKEAEYARWWGKWVGREEEFYIACYEHARKVKPAEFAQNVDDTPQGRRYNAELEARYEAIHAKTVLPTSLVRAHGMKTRHAGANVVVTSYNPYDAFSLERELYEVLGMFDGTQTLAENLERLDKEHDIQLAPELLQYLYTHGVVVAPEPVKEAPVVPPPVDPHARALPLKANRGERRSYQAQKKKTTT
jgi:hypothetical protein